MRIALIPILFMTLVVIFLFLSPVRERIRGADLAKIDAAAKLLTEVMDTANGDIPEPVLEKALAIAIIPNIFRESILYSRGYGEGIIVVRAEDGSWSDPLFVDFVEGTAGSDQGVRTTDTILVFNGKKAIDLLEQNSLVLGESASIASGPLRNEKELAQNQEVPEIYYYARRQDKPSHTSLRGAVLRIDYGLNEVFYNAGGINPGDMVAGHGVKVPLAASRFTCLVAKYTGTTQACG